MNLMSGDVVKVKNLKVLLPENDLISGGSATFKTHDKNEHFVLIFLGLESSLKDGEKINPEDVLRSWGWHFDPSKTKEVSEENEASTK